MQRSSQTPPSPSSESFAGLLASLASPEPHVTDQAPGWGDGELGEDVVTLSYERALRNHSRYKPANAVDLPNPAASGSGPGVTRDVVQRPNAVGSMNPSASLKADDRDLRSTSITVRLSGAESSRLHQRAAEAGVTVSAYLRSCTFEADALRAQVKAVLAELRLTAPDRNQVPAAAPVQHSWLGRMAQLLKRGNSTKPVARA
jgi:hypothetical protein